MAFTSRKKNNVIFAFASLKSVHEVCGFIVEIERGPDDVTHRLSEPELLNKQTWS